MKKILILSIIILVLAGSLAVWSMASTKAGMTESKDESMKSTTVRPLPDSLDKWYEKGPHYLERMFGLGHWMMGIVINTEQGDTENAKIAYQNFLRDYQEIRDMVPEWKGYYDVQVVKKVGNVIETGDRDQILTAMGEVFQTCGPCHTATKTKVWAKYHWKDFNTVKMTVDPSKPPISWKEAKAVYLLSGIDGVMVNAGENQQEATSKSFQQFKDMFQYMKEACSQCHDTERKYYVDDDVMKLIETAEGQISRNELDKAAETMEQIGGICFDCHQTHEPIQRLIEQVS